MTLPEIDHVSFLVEHAQTFFAGEGFIGFRDIAHGMYCGVPATILTSAYLHGPTSVDYILFCDSSEAFANYSFNHLAHADWANLAIVFVKRKTATGYDRLNGHGGSTNSVHSLLVSVAIDSNRLILDLLKDLHAKTLLKTLASTPEVQVVVM